MVERLRQVSPGVLAALAVAVVAQPVAEALGGQLLALQGLTVEGHASPVSAISVAVILGLVLANTVGVSPRLEAGLTVAVQRLLKLGIVLVGLKLSVLDVLRVGVVGVPVVLVTAGTALVVGTVLARRLGVSATLGALAAGSTAICGITATLAIAPVLDADDRDVAYTVANVTVLGLLGMLCFPYLGHAVFGAGSASAGLFLGTAIHDTSQVMGAALSYRDLFDDPVALQVATVTKLTRNLLLVVVVPFLGWRHGRTAGTTSSWRALVPLFVLGFVALSAVRSAGDLGLARGGLALGVLAAADWHALLDLLGAQVASFCLATALAAVGLKTRLEVLVGLGARPALVGLGTAVAVSTVALGLAALAGPAVGL